MPNVLPLKVRARVVRALVEGNSVRSTSRLTSTDKDAVVNLGVKVGEGCARLHDKLVQGVPAGVLEVDETWGFVGRHERRKRKDDPPEWGDRYTMFAVDADTKLVPSYQSGKRTLPTATAFMGDLRARVDGKPQITFDGWPHWIEATRRTFGHRGAHVGTTVKEYQKECPSDGSGTSRSCGRVKSQTKTVIYGTPDQKRISTSKAERLNLTQRMADRRLTRLTNAYSKKADNLDRSADLHYFWYNFVRVHESLGTTPAVRAGLADRPWTIEEMTRAALAEVGDDNPPPGARGRRYNRKTHASDVENPLLVLCPPPVKRSAPSADKPQGERATAGAWAAKFKAPAAPSETPAQATSPSAKAWADKLKAQATAKTSVSSGFQPKAPSAGQTALSTPDTGSAAFKAGHPGAGQ